MAVIHLVRLTWADVKMDHAAEGFVGELSEIMAKVFDGIQNLDANPMPNALNLKNF